MNQRVIFFTRTLFPFAATGQWLNWERCLRQSGRDVTVVSLSDSATSPMAGGADGPRIIRLSLRNRELSGWRRLQALIRSERADILHFWDCPPVLWWLFRDFDGAIFETRVSPPGHESGRWIRRKLRRSDLLMVYQPAILERVNGLASRTSVVRKSPLPCSVARQDARSRLCHELNIPAESIVIAAAARWIPETHCKDLIWGVDLLSCIRDDIQLVLMGTGTQRARLERFARLTEVAARIHFLESPSQAVDVVTAADVYWQADLTNHQPDGALVAMSSHVPVVAALGQATSELVLPQRTALPIRLGAREQLARWTKFLLEQPDRRAQLVAQAAQHVSREFPHAGMQESVQRAYQLPAANAIQR